MAAIAEPVSEAITTPAGPSDEAVGQLYRLTVAQYHAMAKHGILAEDDPVELLEGWLIRKMTKHRPHSRCTGQIRRSLERIVPAGWHVETQEPITTTDSEPEPDVALIRGDPDDYIASQPGAENVALAVEVAETSLRQDRQTKKRVYARVGISIYWIANLREGQIEVL